MYAPSSSGLAEPHPDPVAGHAGLGDLKLRLAYPVPVSDTYLVVSQAVDREVFPELAVAEVGAAEMLLPVPVRRDLVHQHGPLLAAVTLEVSLPVTVDVQPAHHDRPVHGFLPDAGVHSFTLPGDIARQPHVH